MRFFFFEIVARIVAIYLCIDCGRKLQHGLAARKIAYFNNNLLDWLIFDRSNWVADRDATPVRYWIQIGSVATTLLACLVIALFGWWQPNT